MATKGKTREEYNRYMRGYMAERRKRRRAEAIEQLGGKCVKCGGVKDLQLDHVSPATKKFQIGTIPDRNEQDWQAELLKCQLLCRLCHEDKSLADRGFKRALHGTASRYRRGCRCEGCRKANTIYSRAYRERRKRRQNVQGWPSGKASDC